MKALALSLLSLTTLTGCVFLDLEIEGSGIADSERYYLYDFDRIEIAGEGLLVVNNGYHEFIEVTGDDNILHHLEVRKVGRTLIIEPEEGIDFDPTLPLIYYVDMPELEGIEMYGAVEARIKDVDTTVFSAHIHDASILDIEGYAHTAYFDVSGASEVYGFDFETFDTFAEVSGASYVKLNVSDYLTADVSGASTVYYIGNPYVQADVSSGSLLEAY